MTCLVWHLLPTRLITHVQTHTRQDSSGRQIAPSLRPLPSQHTIFTRDWLPCPWGIRNHNLSKRPAEHLRLRPHGYWDQTTNFYVFKMEFSVTKSVWTELGATTTVHSIAVNVRQLLRHRCVAGYAPWTLYALQRRELSKITATDLGYFSGSLWEDWSSEFRIISRTHHTVNNSRLQLEVIGAHCENHTRHTKKEKGKMWSSWWLRKWYMWLQKDVKSLTHCGLVTQICVFNTVKLGTSASSP
jgi:hypothetical protein